MLTQVEKKALEQALTLCLRKSDGAPVVPSAPFVPSPPRWRLEQFYIELLPLRGYDHWKGFYYSKLLGIFGTEYIASALVMTLPEYLGVASTAKFSAICKEKQKEIQELLVRVKSEKIANPRSKARKRKRSTKIAGRGSALDSVIDFGKLDALADCVFQRQLDEGRINLSEAARELKVKRSVFYRKGLLASKAKEYRALLKKKERS